MRKSNNYYKFMEYVSYGKRCDDTICKDNGVLECISYCTVSDIEYYENTTLGVENDWLKIENVLVNEEVIYVYYVKGESTFYIATFILDNYKTQKELKHAIHKAVDEFFINNVDIIKDTETAESEEIEESTEDSAEYKEISDRHESTDSDRINYLMETHSFPSISDMCNDKCFCCPADRPGNRCCGEKWCAETWKRYEAIIKPEWHHVSLSTLANLDIDILDEKRQLYVQLYRELKELIRDLRKCKSGHSYQRRLAKMYIRNSELLDENRVSHDYIDYVSKKISMCNVECGLWTSKVEEATGLHKSRRYNRQILKY